MRLNELLITQITAHGPMSVAAFMSQCLLHPELGYYTSAQPFGRSGDFITAPEISQMFGELIGLSLAQAWIDQGAPARFTLLELGPGRGTLMADIWRATKAVPGFHKSAQVNLFEASPALRRIQAERLEEARPTWIDSLDALPDVPLFAVANEFFDALPIRQFVRNGQGWCERRIGVKDGALCFGLGPVTALPTFSHRLQDTKDGDVIEDCPTAAVIIEALGSRINAQGGAALIFDYGDWRSLGDTLQALKNHTPVDPLTHPGQADLSAHVDFEALARAAPCRYSRITPQGVFLERLGITQRAQSLARKMQGEALKIHIAAHRRLTHPEEMGNLFKVMGLYPEGKTPPAGLEP